MTLDDDLDHIRALGHGAVALFNLACALAIVAVVLSTRSQTVAVLQAFFRFLAWLVSQVITPISGGRSVQLGSKFGTAGSFQSTATGTGTGNAASNPNADPGAASGGTSLNATGGSGTGGSGTLWVNTTTYESRYSPTSPGAGWVQANDLTGSTVNVGGG